MKNLLEATANRHQTGAMQIEFGDKPEFILRNRMGVCTCFAWNSGPDHYETKGIVESFEYASARPPSGAWDYDSSIRADGTAHGFLVALIRPYCWSLWERPDLQRWDLEVDPDPIGSGQIPEDDRIPIAVLGSQFLGLIVDDTEEARNGRPLGLSNLPPPRGLTIEDRNSSTDKTDLLKLSKARAIKRTDFDYLELRLQQSVTITISELLQGINRICRRSSNIRVLVVRLSQPPAGSENIGWNCHMTNLLVDFNKSWFPARLDVLPDHHNDLHFSTNGHPHGHSLRRVFGSGRWDPFHHHLGLRQCPPIEEHLLSLTFTRLQLTDEDVLRFPSHMPSLHTLSVAFNQITDSGLVTLRAIAPNVEVLDLECNEMLFNIGTPAAFLLWKEDSPLRHLNVSHNIPTIENLTSLFWKVGLSNLQTFDAAMTEYPARHVPARLLTFLLSNHALERADLRGIRFCSMPFADPELEPDGPIGRDFAAHPSLKSIFFDKDMFWARQTGIAPLWTRLFYWVLTGDTIGGPPPPLDQNLVIPITEYNRWYQSMTNCTGIRGGFIRRAPVAGASPANHTLWHLSMPDANFNPTADYIEPVIRFNRNARPALSRWRLRHVDDEHWSPEMFDTLEDNTSLKLIPHILAAFQHITLETIFDWRPSHTSGDVLFTTQEHMYPTRRLRHWLRDGEVNNGGSLTITYIVLKGFAPDLQAQRKGFGRGEGEEGRKEERGE